MSVFILLHHSSMYKDESSMYMDDSSTYMDDTNPFPLKTLSSVYEGRLQTFIKLVLEIPV